MITTLNIYKSKYIKSIFFIIFIVLTLQIFGLDFEKMSEEEKCAFAIGEVLGNCLILEEFSLKFPNLKADTKLLEKKCKNDYEISLANIDLYLINTIGEPALKDLKIDLRNKTLTNSKYKELFNSFDRMSEKDAKNWIDNLNSIEVIFSPNTLIVLEKYRKSTNIKDNLTKDNYAKNITEQEIQNSDMTVLKKALFSGDYATYFLILIISFILTYFIGLSIPLLLRFVIVRKNFSKLPLWITLIFWFSFQIEFWSTYGDQSKFFHGGVCFATIFSYNILRYGKIWKNKKKVEISKIEHCCPECNEENLPKLAKIGLHICPKCGRKLNSQ